MSHSPALAPSATSRVLGAAGILGGTVLLAAFVLGIPAGVNTLRLILYILGAIAVVVAVASPAGVAGSRLRRLSPHRGDRSPIACVSRHVPAVASADRSRNGAVAPDLPATARSCSTPALAMWLADAAFGFVALRLGAVTSLGRALALARRVPPGDPRDEPSRAHVAGEHRRSSGRSRLIGVALNGVAWILLGLDVMLGASAALRLRSALAR